MLVELTKFNFIELIYLKKMVVRVVFFRLINIVICLMIKILINNVKIKT